MSNVSSTGFVSALQKAVNALENNLKGKTLVLAGKVWKESDLVDEIQAAIEALDAVAPGRGSWVRATAAAKAARASITPLMLALRTYIAALYGEASTVFEAFGFTSRKQGRPSAATVAVRVLKNLATRKARMTMSKKQKQAIKGVVTSSDVAAAVTAASAVAPGVQPAASAVPSNVPGNGNGVTH
jgi:hypothetical protein